MVSSVGGINKGLRADGIGKSHRLIVLHFQDGTVKGGEENVHRVHSISPLLSALSNYQLNHFGSVQLNSVTHVYILVEQISRTFSSDKN